MQHYQTVLKSRKKKRKKKDRKKEKRKKEKENAHYLKSVKLTNLHKSMLTTDVNKLSITIDKQVENSSSNYV